MKKESCPKCGEPGKSVKEITLQSLLKENEKEHITALPYFFCKTPSCPVIYFDQSGDSIFEKNNLTVRVGIKENEAPRLVCYCFDHSIEEIEEQVDATGESTVLDDIATRMKDDCWCETKSPMGSCCMPTVSKHIKTAKAKAGLPTSKMENDPTRDCCAESDDHAQADKKPEDCSSVHPEPSQANTNNPGRKLGILATIAAVFTAVLSSACCWLPLLLIVFEASAAGVSGFFETYRFWFLGTTGILLATGFYLVYFRQKTCTAGSACATPTPKLQKLNQVTLWVATIMVTLFSFFPNYLGIFLGASNAGENIPKNLDQATIRIEGMTCKACTSPIQNNLENVEGVTYAHVDFVKASALIGVPAGSKIPQQGVLKAIEGAGFKGSFQQLVTKTLSIKGMTCKACAIGAQKKLSAVTGVENVLVDYENKKATIIVEPSVSDQTLTEAVQEAGYKALIEKDSKKNTLADDCCKVNP